MRPSVTGLEHQMETYAASVMALINVTMASDPGAISITSRL